MSLPVRSVGQARQDTAVTVRGFLEPADSGGWGLLLPDPLVVEGRRANWLTARGDDARWRRLEHQFVTAIGQVALGPADAVIQVERLEEVEPEGLRRATVHLSFNQMAVVTLAAIPNHFTWRLSDGGASGVQPLLMYTILNHGLTEIDFMLPTNEVLCARVRHTTDRTWWRKSLPGPTRNPERIMIRLGGVYRQFVSIPPEAAPGPGRYLAHVTLCGIADYGVEAEFEVRTP